MNLELEGKRVLVTGGSSGSGEAMALAFADAGADVAINYARQSAAAQHVVEAVIQRPQKPCAPG
jgi:NAD(P)-dependent dehydrogenase (short-subunit alcohol dehydrogenase family)